MPKTSHRSSFETDADTVALYHLDEGKGDVLTDRSGNKQPGTIYGARWVNADGSAADKRCAPPRAMARTIAGYIADFIEPIAMLALIGLALGC